MEEYAEAAELYASKWEFPDDQSKEVLGEIYIAQVLKVEAEINDVAIAAMIDTGAEVNCITDGLASYLGLLVVPHHAVRVKVQTQHTVPCLGYTEVPVNVEGVRTWTKMWVMDRGENGFILGRPWQEQVRWGCQTMKDGQVNCWAHDPESGARIHFIGYMPDIDPKRRQVAELYGLEQIGTAVPVSESLEERAFDTPLGEVIVEEGYEHDKHPLMKVDYKGTSGGIGTMRAVSWRVAQAVGLSWDYWTERNWDPLTSFGGFGKAKHKKERFVVAEVNTMYKRKADKVQPVDESSTDGAPPAGYEDWQERCLTNYYQIQPGEELRDGLFFKRLAKFPRGERLTQERIEKLNVGMKLREAETEILIEVLFRREGCLGWSFSDVKRIRPEVAPDVRISTVEHKAWQERGFKVPQALRQKVVNMLKERLNNGIMERCEGPYRNPWFLVPKKNGDFRLIIGATKMNSVTRRDANMPPNVDEFSEDFGGCAVTSLVDLFSGYDQLILHVLDRNLTAIMTPLGLLRMTRVVQGGTNSVAQFVRIITKILEDIIPDKCQVFLDDIGIKGPKTRYNDEESTQLPGCRRYIVEHLVNLDHTLFLLEVAGATLSVEKSQFLYNGVKIVGWICDYDGRRAETKKVDKILNWPRPESIRDIRSFVSTASYFRVLIREFQWTAAPLYEVLKSKTPRFRWDTRQQEAFDELKQILATNPVVLPLDYSLDPLNIIVAVDASSFGWGAVLMQHQRGRRHPARYESGIWTKAESEYDAGKREARGVLKALKKFKSFLYGVHFVIEVDSETVVAQLNRSATDLPGAIVNQWLAWIRLFDFEIRHVKGTKHGGPDGLSRRPASEEESNETEEDIDERVAADLSPLIARISPIENWHHGANSGNRVLDAAYSDESEAIAQWLLHQVKPRGLTGGSLTAFKKKCTRYIVQDDQLYRRRKNGEQPSQVIDPEEDRQRILHACHEELGHRGREGTYYHIKRRYYWDCMYKDVVKHVKTCHDCQMRDPNRLEEPLNSTTLSTLFRRINMDVTYMPPSNGKKYLLVARDDLSHWVEARALRSISSKTVAQFFYEEIVCRHGVPYEVMVDGGPENQKELVQYLKDLHVQLIRISPYNSKAAGNVEVGHKILQNALSKITKGSGKNWTHHLPAALFSDRTTTKKSTGYSPYELLYGESAILPIECEVPTWQTRNWSKIRNTTDLIAARARQIERRDGDIVEASHRLERMRDANRSYFDEKHQLRLKPLQPEDMVLLHNTKRDNEMTSERKLAYRWIGPYKIHRTHKNGTYTIKELDGAVRAETVHGNRLKHYLTRNEYLNLIERTPTTEASRIAEPSEEEIGTAVPGTDDSTSESEGEEEGSQTSELEPTNNTIPDSPQTEKRRQFFHAIEIPRPPTNSFP